MSENLVLLSDREVLTRTLLEIERLLERPATANFKLSSFRARSRVLWLLRTLCTAYLTSLQVSQIEDRSSSLRAILSANPQCDRDLSLSQLLELSVVQARALR